MLLIGLNIFEEINLLFLPVGHTHWENDQSFSKLSVYIKNDDSGMKLLEQLFNLFQNAWHRNNDSFNWNYGGYDSLIDKFPNFKIWFDNVSKKSWPKIHNLNIRKYYRFNFYKNIHKVYVKAYTQIWTEEEAKELWSNDLLSTYRNLIKEKIYNEKLNLNKEEKECLFSFFFVCGCIIFDACIWMDVYIYIR